MPSIMDRLFPARKPRTSTTVSARLASARDALADAQARLADSAERRDTAPLANDRAGFLAAKADAETAAFDAEVAAIDIAALEQALAVVVAEERAEVRSAEVAKLTARGAPLEARFRAEFLGAAAIIADLLTEAASFNRDRQEAGLAADVPAAPEAMRGRMLRDSIATVPARLGGEALTAVLRLDESDAEREHREAEAAAEANRSRRKAEKDAARAERIAEAARLAAEERQAERDAEEAREARETIPYYPASPRDVVARVIRPKAVH